MEGEFGSLKLPGVCFGQFFLQILWWIVKWQCHLRLISKCVRVFIADHFFLLLIVVSGTQVDSKRRVVY